jgi:hypothetical protein
VLNTAIIREALSNASSYVKYIVHDGDTPEILASKVYGDPQAHWMILYANDMLDAQYDWPMTSTVFPKYIADKYRSMAQDDLDPGRTLEDYEVIAWTQDLTNEASVHHYEKVIRLENELEQLTTETRYIINKTRLTDNELDVPYDYYQGTGSLAAALSYEPINVNGETVIQTVSSNAVTYFNYEEELNETKRNIRIIKKEYYNQIKNEFGILTDTNAPAFMRRVT